MCVCVCVCVCVSTVTWECTEIRPFGDAPLPRRRVGCAKVGNNLMICGGTRYMYICSLANTHTHTHSLSLLLSPSLSLLTHIIIVQWK